MLIYRLNSKQLAVMNQKNIFKIKTVTLLLVAAGGLCSLLLSSRAGGGGSTASNNPAYCNPAFKDSVSNFPDTRWPFGPGGSLRGLANPLLTEGLTTLVGFKILLQLCWSKTVLAEKGICLRVLDAKIS